MGRGRPPSAKTLVDRQLGRNRQVLPAGDNFVIPNYSGTENYLDEKAQYVKFLGIAPESQTITNTTDETTVAEFPFAANTLKAVTMLRFRGMGQMSTASGADFLVLRVYLNGVAISTTTMVALLVTDEPYDSSGFITLRTDGAAGIGAVHIDTEVGGTTSSSNDNNISIDTTALLTLKLTAQWNNAKVGNVFRQDQGFIEILKQPITI